MADALLSLLLERAAKENAAMVDPKPVAAESRQGPKTWPLAAYLGGLGADVATTGMAMRRQSMHEANPAIGWLPKGAVAPVAAGVGVGGALLLRKLLGKNHPGLVDALMMGGAGAHGIAAASNIHELHKNSAQTAAGVPHPDDTPPFPGAVKLPGGGWGNPDYISGLK